MSRPDAHAFVTRWKNRELTERASAQAHFIDLCDLLGVPRPTDNREVDSTYGFEVRTELPGAAAFAQARRTGGDDPRQSHLFSIVTGRTTGPTGGFCDVWKQGHFCWEYKRSGKYASLEAVFAQLNQYRDHLGNPPLLVACDLDTIEIRTNFTGFVPAQYLIRIDDLVSPSHEWRDKYPGRSPIDVLRAVFDNPESLRPRTKVNEVTEKLAAKIGDLAVALRNQGRDPEVVAHFLMQMVFCFFAEDAGFLPKDLMTGLIESSIERPASFTPRVRELYKTMATGGYFGEHPIKHFNGGLFVDGDTVPDLEINSGWLGHLLMVARSDWSNVEPSIFGTLFERSLDPDKRSQIGAHYTSREDIMLVIEPVILRPLRVEWRGVQEQVIKELDRRANAKTTAAKRAANKRIGDLIDGFHERLWGCRVLDPACGSGNFLYVALQCLLDLEIEVRTFAARREIEESIVPRVHPGQLLGIEINTYACELARVSIWIGYLQWHRSHGDTMGRTPILEPLDTIENRDAILAWADERGRPIPVWRDGAACLGQAEWPEADYIIGNPPFLGSKLFRKWGLAEAYIQAMYASFELSRTSDLCCYWFEIARQVAADRRAVRFGLLATQAIRGQFNRGVLERLCETASIFEAWSDREWILDGAAVQVSMVMFSGAADSIAVLDGAQVDAINPDLTAGLFFASAETLKEMNDQSFMGDTKGGSFDIEHESARRILAAPNSNGFSSIEVVKPWMNGDAVTGRPAGNWIIDFGTERTLDSAAGFDAAFRHVESHVKAERQKNRRASYREMWWIHAEPRPNFRQAIGQGGYVATPNLTKYRFFVRLASVILPDHQIIAFARSDDYFFGVLHSSIHELWARRQGTQLREYESGFRYTPTTCFETFPMPWPPGKEPGKKHAIHAEISAAAHDLNAQRERWLNPPEWIKPIAEKIDRFDKFDDVAQVSGEEARRLIRQSAIDAAAAEHPKLKKRTLTNLYNERPAWLAIAHERLDRAVVAAYREIDPEGEWNPEWAAVWKETGAGQPIPADADNGEAKRAHRAEIEQRVLANLLRLNQQRASSG